MTISKKKIFLIVLVIIIAIPLTLMLINKGAPVAWGWWGPVNSDAGIAIHGYDPVAYFNNNQAKPGSQEHSTQWSAVTWVFSSQENKSLFEQQPEKYAPAYGGYCATAVSAGITFESDPAAWHIDNDRLYLFFDDAARDDWISRIQNNIVEVADRNWATRSNQINQ